MGLLSKLFKRNRETKESAVARVIVSGQGPVIWTPRNYKNFAEETYMKNVVSFRCILKIAESVGSVPWVLSRQISDDKSEPVKEHPVKSLLKRPNPDDSLAFVIMSTVAYFVMSGNAFIERVTPTTGPNREAAKEIYTHRPDRIKQHVSGGRLSSYSYTVGGESHTFEIDPITRRSDLLHLRSFHPLNDFWGMAITEPIAREIDTSNEAVQWGKKTFQNEGRPGLVLTVPPETGDNEFKLMERMLRERHTGPEFAGANLLLRGGTATPYGWSPKEMDFIVSNQDLARRISFGYGVPAMLLNIPGDNTYANYGEAREAFWDETVMWYLKYLKGELDNWFFVDEPDLFLNFVLDEVPAFAAKRDRMWTRAKEADFLLLNEKREMVKKPPIKGGDVILIPATMIPIGEGQSEFPPPEEEEETEKQTRIRLSKEGYSEEEIDRMLGEEG